MTHTDLLHTNTYPGTSGSHTSLHDLIRSSLDRAFPLPATGAGQDERFGRLLAALAQRSGGHWTAARARQPQETTLDDRVLVTLLVGSALGGLAAMIGGAYGISLLLAVLP